MAQLPKGRNTMNSRTTRNLFTALLAGVVGILMLSLPSIAAAKDRNHDRIPDRWEKRHGLSLKVNQAHRDQDRDNLVNRKEFKAGDDPLDPDSDGDGTEDGDEGAGTIASFDGTTLTINLFNGGTISGQVTDQTEVQCDNGDDQGDEDGDGEGGDDDTNSGDDDSGDDGSGGDDKSASAETTSSDDDPGDVESGDDDQGDDGSSCSSADLVEGATVQEADLEGGVFTEIELAE
jgi:hypothetical protein